MDRLLARLSPKLEALSKAFEFYVGGQKFLQLKLAKTLSPATSNSNCQRAFQSLGSRLQRDYTSVLGIIPWVVANSSQRLKTAGFSWPKKIRFGRGSGAFLRNDRLIFTPNYSNESVPFC